MARDELGHFFEAVSVTDLVFLRISNPSSEGLQSLPALAHNGEEGSGRIDYRGSG